MVAIAVVGIPDDPSPDTGVAHLPGPRRASPAAPLDSTPATSLDEISGALHRASVALAAMAPGSPGRPRAGRRAEFDATGNVVDGTGRDTAQDNITRAIALVDGLSEASTALPRDLYPQVSVVPGRGTGDHRADGAHGVAPEYAEALQGILDRIAGDLNSSILRRGFEASLVLHGALQFVSDDEVTARIGTVIGLLDDNIRQVRTLIDGLGSHGDLGGVWEGLS